MEKGNALLQEIFAAWNFCVKIPQNKVSQPKRKIKMPLKKL